MASVFKKFDRKPIPEGAEVVTRRGQRLARWKNARGRTETAPLSEDGNCILLERRCWYIAYYGEAGRVVTKGYTDREASEALARDLQRQAERKQAGLVTVDPDKIKAKIGDVIELYAQDLEAVGRDDKYVYNCRKRLNKLAAECGWVTPAQIRLDGLTAWRKEAAKLGKAPRTLNHYVETLNAFIGWCVNQHYLAGNPIAEIAKADESDKRRLRRGLDLDQLRKLLEASGVRWLIYLTAMKTGLRRDELGKLQWGDVHLEGDWPHIHFRGTANKARREDSVPLDAELVEALMEAKPPDAKGDDLVFAKVPAVRTLKKDLERAGIPYKDDQGRQADFHSLRVSYNMLLAKAGVPVRVAMHLMRHTDMKLTTKTYTDPRLLDMGAEVGKLPRLLEKPELKVAEAG